MPLIEKTPAEWAELIDEAYASAANPGALPDIVKGIIENIAIVGHDQGVEAVAVFLESVGRDGPDQGMANREAVERFIQRLVDGALKLKKGKVS